MFDLVTKFFEFRFKNFGYYLLEKINKLIFASTLFIYLLKNNNFINIFTYNFKNV